MNLLWSKLYRINVNNSIQNKDTSLYVNIVNYTLDKNSDHSKENKATNTLNTYTMYKNKYVGILLVENFLSYDKSIELFDLFIWEPQGPKCRMLAFKISALWNLETKPKF